MNIVASIGIKVYGNRYKLTSFHNKIDVGRTISFGRVCFRGCYSDSNFYYDSLLKCLISSERVEQG